MTGSAAAVPPRRARRVRMAVAGLAVAAAVSPAALPATGQAAAQAAAAQAIPAGRGDVLLRRDCRSAIAREEVTLFGNGTVRLRSGPLGEERMVLVEVTRDEVESLVAAIRAEVYAEAGAGSAGPEGDWVERCLLELPVLAAAAPDEEPASAGAPRNAAGGGEGGSEGGREGGGDPAGGEEAGPVAGGPAGTARTDPPLGPGRPSGDRPATRFRYGHLDSLSLPLARVVGLIDELAARATLESAAGRLRADYRPRQGDVLRRADGVLFRVVRSTAPLDGLPGGWELQGVVQPLAVYVYESDLPREFVELVSRDEPDGP